MKTRVPLAVSLGLAGLVVSALPAACSVERGGFSGTEGDGPSCKEVRRTLSSDDEVVAELGFSVAQLWDRLGGVYETHMEWLPIDTPPHRQSGKEALTVTLERGARTAELVLCAGYEDRGLSPGLGGADGAAAGGAGETSRLSDAEYEALTNLMPFLRMAVVVHLTSESGTMDETLEVLLEAHEIDRARAWGFLPPADVMGSVKEELLEFSNNNALDFGVEVVVKDGSVQGRWLGGFRPHESCRTEMVVFPPHGPCHNRGRPLALGEPNARSRFERAVKQLEGEHELSWTDGSPGTTSLQLSLSEGREPHCIEEDPQVAYFSVEIAVSESSGRFTGVLQGTLDVDETHPGLPRVRAWDALSGSDFATNQGTFDAAFIGLWLSMNGGYFEGLELVRDGFPTAVPVGDIGQGPVCYGHPHEWWTSFMRADIEER